MKNYTIWLPYYKQGDDLAHCLKDNGPQQALREHAEVLMCAAKQLTDIADLVGDTEIELDADTHHIGISGPQELLDLLVEKELVDVYEDDFDSDFEDDDFEFNKDDLEEEYEQ